MNYHRIAEIARRFDSYAVIGAYALAAHGYVRFTADFDLMTTDRRALRSETWHGERADGIHVEIHKGDFDDPLGGVARIRADDLNVDVVVAKYDWQQGVIDRAELMTFGEVELRVPRLSDMVLLKIDAGGHLDMRDVSELLALGRREEVLAELGRLMPDLPLQLQGRLAGFLEAGLV